MALVFAVALCNLAHANVDAGNGRRVALVIGNSEYESVYSLANPVNDSGAIGSMLEDLGFEVTVLNNVGRDDFENAIETFASSAEGSDATLFYFAGHGFQLGGANYLVPSDAVLESREAIERNTLRLDSIISRLQSRNRQTLIFLDACRNNPLPASVRGASGDGLAQVETGSGVFVAFATQPGNITVDGQGENSPFTLALVDNLTTPGISVSDLMIRVRNSVEERTLGTQTPWDQSSLRSQFYFVPEEERSAALTEEDKELLMSLEPELRERFALQFGLRIESVDDQEPMIPVVQSSIQISSVPDEEQRPAAPPPAIPSAGLTIVAVEEEDADEPAPSTATLDPQAADALQEPMEVARLDPQSQSARAPTVFDPVTVPSAIARAPQAGVAAESQALRPGSAVAALQPSTDVVARAAPAGPSGGALLSAPSEGPVTLRPGVDGNLAPVSPSATRLVGEEVSAPRDSETVDVAALEQRPDSVVDAVQAPRAQAPVPGAATLVPTPETSGAPAGGTDVAALDPAQIRPEPIERAPEQPETEPAVAIPADLPRAIQAELERLGCYRSGVDGIWGPGSARALLRYYATKKQSPDETEPSATLYVRLTEEDQVVCTRTETVTPPPQRSQPRQAPQRERAAPRREAPVARQQPAQRQAAPQRSVQRQAPAAEAPARRIGRTLGTGSFR